MASSVSHGQRFALVTAIFEGGLAVLAVGIGWGWGTSPVVSLQWNGWGILQGLAATLPLLVMLWVTLRLPLRPFRRITRILDHTLVPLFAECRLLDLAIVAMLAGLGEEMFFRGIIQAAVGAEIGEPHGAWVGLLVAAALFGLLHAITPTYAALAGLIGVYFGWLWLATGNLLVPITVHSVYDFLALVYFIRLRPRSSLYDASDDERSPLA